MASSCRTSRCRGVSSDRSPCITVGEEGAARPARPAGDGGRRLEPRNEENNDYCSASGRAPTSGSRWSPTPGSAPILIGHTAGNERFRSEAAFALQTGTAPIPCSSGKRTQHRLNRGGDRQLNHALHIIAVTRAQHDPATKEYL